MEIEEKSDFLSFLSSVASPLAHADHALLCVCSLSFLLLSLPLLHSPFFFVDSSFSPWFGAEEKRGAGEASRCLVKRRKNEDLRQAEQLSQMEDSPNVGREVGKGGNERRILFLFPSSTPTPFCFPVRAHFGWGLVCAFGQPGRMHGAFLSVLASFVFFLCCARSGVVAVLLLCSFF